MEHKTDNEKLLFYRIQALEKRVMFLEAQIEVNNLTLNK